MLKPILLISITVFFSLFHSAKAQTPSRNLMPDGSHDMYIGLGVIHRPKYEGAQTSKTTALPALQIQWSNGIFVAGMSAGMQLSESPQIEYGPLLTIAPGRTDSGIANSVDIVNGQNGYASINTPQFEKKANKLTGLDVLQTRLLVGGFLHKQLTENVQSTNILTYGSGNQHNGLKLVSDLRYQIKNLAQHHTITLGSGITLVNQAYNQTYFGISQQESDRTGRNSYIASGGMKDIHADINWNWSFSASYLLTSKINFTYLTGSASKSPLVERRSNVSISTALAYRF